MGGGVVRESAKEQDLVTSFGKMIQHDSATETFGTCQGQLFILKFDFRWNIMSSLGHYMAK